MQILNFKYKFFYLALIFVFYFSCSTQIYKRLSVSGLNNNTLELNTKQKKYLDIDLPDERDTDSLKILVADPAVARVESSRTRVIEGLRPGKTVLQVVYKNEKIVINVRVYDSEIQTN